MAEVVELHKLKLAELKQECIARGLEVKGNKQDLINRLQAYLDTHVEEEVNEEEVLGDDTEEEPKEVEAEQPHLEEVVAIEKEDLTSGNQEKNVVKTTPPISLDERLRLRAERFNVPVTADSKKAARAARFGMASTPLTGSSVTSKPSVNVDQLKKRAQRFGMNVSSVSKKAEEDEKLKKRKERFGIVTSAAGTTEDNEAKKRKRAERFGNV